MIDVLDYYVCNHPGLIVDEFYRLCKSRGILPLHGNVYTYPYLAVIEDTGGTFIVGLSASSQIPDRRVFGYDDIPEPNWNGKKPLDMNREELASFTAARFADFPMEYSPVGSNGWLPTSPSLSVSQYLAFNTDHHYRMKPSVLASKLASIDKLEDIIRDARLKIANIEGELECMNMH